MKIPSFKKLSYCFTIMEYSKQDYPFNNKRSQTNIWIYRKNIISSFLFYYLIIAEGILNNIFRFYPYSHLFLFTNLLYTRNNHE